MTQKLRKIPNGNNSIINKNSFAPLGNPENKLENGLDMETDQGSHYSVTKIFTT